MRGATYYASSSPRSIAFSKGFVFSVITLRVLLLVFALAVFAAPSFAQTVIEPCPATPSPSPAKPVLPPPVKTDVRAKQSTIDASVPGDAAVEKMLAPYTEKVRELSVVVGKLEGGPLKKDGAGAGSLGNFVTDGMRAQAKAKLGKPITLAIMNAGGLRKTEIAAGELRASDIFELLPFENALVALEVNGTQLAKLLQVVARDAQSGARIQFKWNDQNRAEFLSGKLLDESGQEQEIDPNKTYTIVTIDYLLNLNSGAYALLHEATSKTPLNLTLRQSIMDYVKAETAAGRNIQPRLDGRYVQVGPDRKRAEDPK